MVGNMKRQNLKLKANIKIKSPYESVWLSDEDEPHARIYFLEKEIMIETKKSEEDKENEKEDPEACGKYNWVHLNYEQLKLIFDVMLLETEIKMELGGTM